MFISPRALHQTLHNYEIFICYDLWFKLTIGSHLSFHHQDTSWSWCSSVQVDSASSGHLKNGSRRKQKCVSGNNHTEQANHRHCRQLWQARVTSCAVTFVARCLSGTEYSLRRCQCPRNNLLVTAHVQKYLESFTVCSTP